MKSFVEMVINEVDEIRNLERILKNLEMLCLEDLNTSKNILNKNIPAFFDIDENGKTFFLGFKEGKLVDYINHISKILNVSDKNIEILLNSLLASIEMLNDLGYESISEEDKIKEIFSFAKHAIRVKCYN